MVVMVMMVSERGRRRRVNRSPDAGRSRGGRHLLLMMMVVMLLLRLLLVLLLLLMLLLLLLVLLLVLLLLQKLLHLSDVHEFLQLAVGLRAGFSKPALRRRGHNSERVPAVVLQVVETRERIRGLVIAAPGRVFAAHRQCQHLFNLSRRRPSSRCQSSTCSSFLASARPPDTLSLSSSRTTTTTRRRTTIRTNSRKTTRRRLADYRTCHDASHVEQRVHAMDDGATRNETEEVSRTIRVDEPLSRSISSPLANPVGLIIHDDDTRVRCVGQVRASTSALSFHDICVSTLRGGERAR